MRSNPIRILVANIPAALEHGPGGDYLRQVLVPLTRRNAAAVSRAETELVFRFASNGFSHPAFSAFKYLPLLNPAAMITVVQQAESEGFDAAIVGCFGDPFLAEIRAAAAIPVVGFGEAGLGEALSRGGRMGVVTPSPFLIEPTRAQIAGYGMSDRLAGIVATTEPAEHQEAALVDASGCSAAFTLAARALIAAGADVLVPGCGLMSPALRMGPGRRAGLTEVDGRPVIDVIGAAVSAAENAVLAARRDGTSGRGVRPAYPDAEAAESHFPMTPPGMFWDCR